jgi:hypothetical protein
LIATGLFDDCACPEETDSGNHGPNDPKRIRTKNIGLDATVVASEENLAQSHKNCGSACHQHVRS